LLTGDEHNAGPRLGAVLQLEHIGEFFSPALILYTSLFLLIVTLRRPVCTVAVARC